MYEAELAECDEPRGLETFDWDNPEFQDEYSRYLKEVESEQWWEEQDLDKQWLKATIALRNKDD